MAKNAIAQEAIGPQLLKTVGALAVGYLYGYLKKAGLTRKRFYPWLFLLQLELKTSLRLLSRGAW